MHAQLSSITTFLQRTEPLSPSEHEDFRRASATLTQATPDDVSELLATLLHTPAPDAVQRDVLDHVLSCLVLRQRQVTEPMTAQVRQQISLLYNMLGEASTCRWRLLQWLSTAAQEADLRLFVELLVASPPRDAQAAAVALAPLFQRVHYDPSTLFPALFDALQYPSLAAPVLDLANYLLRSHRVDEHPARDRAQELIALLGNLVQRLAKLEESPGETDESWEALRRQVDESVALIVALCDALAFLGDAQAIGKLYQALELSHRRIRVEAAAALARLGETAGAETLVALAAEPVVRLRVLSRAEELGISGQVDPQYTSDVAQAEALVAVELAQPAFFGIPPAELALVDTRTQFWPGYEAPVCCYLFRYVYRFASGEYGNVAIAGPLVHAFAADLSDLPPEDIYAAYAGWHGEHESIDEVSLDVPSANLRPEIERFERRLRDAGYQDVQSVTLGRFFGDRVLVAHATREGAAGIAVIDAQETEWHPRRTRQHAIGPSEAFCIYKGRRLLRAFNH
ncbi:MAG: HEAT repeat domain-containing protein [Pirellulaceae bacterium]